MAVLNTDSLYFFDQPKQQFKKRERKPVDQLPFALPFTGVSGTLKVEAYLKQQLKISEHAVKETPDDPQLVSDVNADFKAEDGGKNKTVSPSLVQSKTREVDQEAVPRQTEHTRSDKIFPSSVANFSRDRDEDEEEDTQRFLFEENKFAAPNLLAQLAQLLEWLYEKQLEKTDATNRYANSDNRYENWANLTSNNSNKTIINSEASALDLRVLDITVPFHLQERLKWNFDQLIANTVYSKRQWQTTGYRQQAMTAQRGIVDEPPQDIPVNINGSKSNAVKLDNPSGSKRPRKGSDDQGARAAPGSEASPVIEKGESSCSTPMEEPTAEVPPPASVLGFRRESVKGSVSFNTPKTRLEKYKYLPNKAVLGPIRRRRAGAMHVKLDVEQENEKGNKEVNNIVNNAEVSMQVQPPHSSVAFSLMSRTCEEKGWVNHGNQDDDLERLTVIEWARDRLQQAMSSRTLCALKAKEKGEDGPLIVKQYGGSKGDLHYGKDDGFLSLKDVKDDRQDGLPKRGKDAPVVFKKYGESTVVKTKKGKQRIERTPSGTAKIDLFVIVLPDSTMNLYYPSGKIAVCVAKNIAGEGKYTYVYSDDGDDTMLAYFTPTHGFCCDKHGKRVFCTPKEGVIYDKEGAILRKWAWKISKLIPAVVLELNRFLTLRIVSRGLITLHFNAKQETYKVPVGITQDRHNAHVNTTPMGGMMTTGEYLSEAAQQPIPKPKPRNKREERRTKANQRKSIPQANVDLQEQRREELDKKFPERKNLALDLPSDIELYKLKRRIKNVAYEWMESYRLLVGISSPVKVTGKHARRKQVSSAKSLPGALPSSQDPLCKLHHAITDLSQRAPSAPPVALGDKHDVSKSLPLDRLLYSAQGLKEHKEEATMVPSIYLTEVEKQRFTTGVASPRTPFRFGMSKYEPRSCSAKEGCPVALRADILGERQTFCRCRKREIPFVSDVAYDLFIREHVPSTQLLVVSIMSSRHPGDTPCTSMLEQLYFEKNKNRSFPCPQARHDPFRIVFYDVDSSLKTCTPLLVKRHNVVPGMFLMYIGGKLLFADHIFNGYGNARKDFLKQITKSRKDFLQGLFLPEDFRLSPTPCRSGPRSAWGGEIGGLSKIVCRTESNISRNFSSPGDSRLPSAVTSASSDSIVVRANGAKSAASFINLGLSIEHPTSPFTRHKFKSSSQPRKTAPQSRA